MLLDRIVKWLLPREDRFFLYLESIAKNVEAGADAFEKFRSAKGREDFQKIAEHLRELEHEGDELAHIVYEELDRTFVTPFDREDLHALASTLDDVIDTIESTAHRIVLYRLEKLTEPMCELVRIIHEATHEVARCVSVLRDMRKVEEINVHVVHVNSLENEGDRIYTKAIEQVFLEVKDPIELLREKEVLDALERTIDATEDVMDLIRSVVVKNG